MSRIIIICALAGILSSSAKAFDGTQTPSPPNVQWDTIAGLCHATIESGAITA